MMYWSVYSHSTPIMRQLKKRAQLLKIIKMSAVMETATLTLAVTYSTSSLRWVEISKWIMGHGIITRSI
jgi:hypothetical protein